jgi:hypothetical protein
MLSARISSEAAWQNPDQAGEFEIELCIWRILDSSTAHVSSALTSRSAHTQAARVMISPASSIPLSLVLDHTTTSQGQ